MVPVAAANGKSLVTNAIPAQHSYQTITSEVSGRLQIC